MTTFKIAKALLSGCASLLIATALAPAAAASAMGQASLLRGGSFGQIYDGAIRGSAAASPVLAAPPVAVDLGGSRLGSRAAALLDQTNVPSVRMGASHDSSSSSSGGGSDTGLTASKLVTGGVMGLMGFALGGALLGPVGAVAGAGLGLLAAGKAAKGSPVAAGAAKLGMGFAGASLGASLVTGVLAGAAHGALLGPVGLIAGAIIGGIAGIAIAEHATGR